MTRNTKRGRKSKRRSAARRGRPEEALGRIVGNRPPRAHILITCEGAKTEPHYFEALRNRLKLRPVEVQVEGSKDDSAPIKVVNLATRLRAERIRAAKSSQILGEYDEIWCVIDTEGSKPHTTFMAAVDKAKKESIKLIVSNPAFEYWYLLHIEDTTRPFSNGRAVKKALKAKIPDYRENKSMFQLLYAQTDVAIQRAKRILKKQIDVKKFPNPSTNVYQLVEHLKTLASR